MFASTCPEAEYHFDVCRATNGAHTEICWVHKELCEVHCLKMWRFIQYILRLKIYNVLSHGHLKPDILYLILNNVSGMIN
jgi:hypothetical protein